MTEGPQMLEGIRAICVICDEKKMGESSESVADPADQLSWLVGSRSYGCLPSSSFGSG